MGKTAAEVLREEGEKRGEKKGELRTLRRTLLELLLARFDEVPEETRRTIRETTSVRQLDQWLRRLVSARTLEEMRIGPSS